MHALYESPFAKSFALYESRNACLRQSCGQEYVLVKGLSEELIVTISTNLKQTGRPKKLTKQLNLI